MYGFQLIQTENNLYKTFRKVYRIFKNAETRLECCPDWRRIQLKVDCQHRRNSIVACIYINNSHRYHLGLGRRSHVVAVLENQMPLPLELSAFLWLHPTLGFFNEFSESPRLKLYMQQQLQEIQENSSLTLFWRPELMQPRLSQTCCVVNYDLKI